MDEGPNINEVSRLLNVILDARETSATRLKVMAELFLSDGVAKSYIDLIIRAGLIDCENEKTFYKITNAGREWLAENGKYVRFSNFSPAPSYMRVPRKQREEKVGLYHTIGGWFEIPRQSQPIRKTIH